MLAVSVVSLFALALVSPLVVRAAGRWSGWLIALAPAGWCAWYAGHLGAVAEDGVAIAERTAWAPEAGLWLSWRLDGLAMLFALLVLGIGALVCVYAGGYLRGHAQLGRFFGFLLAFMASMLGLVVSDNVILVFVFWELTSVTSYLLIGFGHEREKARKAALQALLVTGAGGLALLAGLVLVGIAAGTFEIAEMGNISGHELYPAALVLVLAGCFTKSAQFPFHFWLPGAMEAPAPVSAYLHSSTMVKAGVFLLAKLNLVMASDSWEWTLKTVGAFTMVYAAYLAARSTPLKRVLAYTTVSALGGMVMLVGLGVPGEAALAAYLLAHALYKGTLFMVAGGVEHATHEKDAEKLGGLFRVMPVTAVVGGLGALSMAGLPPFFGYTGKDLMKGVLDGSPLETALLVAVVLTTAFTMVAALVVAFRPFFGRVARDESVAHDDGAGAGGHVKESGPSLLLGPAVLAILGVLVGVAPGLFASSLVSSATLAVTGEAPGEGLKLAATELVKPGTLFGPTAVGIAAGVVLYVLRRPLRRGIGVVHDAVRVSPELGYDGVVNGTLAFARWQTRVLQNGSLGAYLRTVVSAIVVAVGAAFILRVPLDEIGAPAVEGTAAEGAFDVVLVLVLAGGAVMSTLFRQRLASVAALGVVGVIAALIFVLFGAPDVAMTQFAIDILTVLILVLVFYHLPQFRTMSKPAAYLGDWVLSGVFGALMAALILVSATHDFASPASAFYSEASVPAAFGRNIVNVILVDFRATDTFGEILVLALAALGVVSLLRVRVGVAGSSSIEGGPGG